MRGSPALLVLLLLFSGCADVPGDSEPTSLAPAPPSHQAATPAPATAAAVEWVPTPERRGSAIARSPHDDVLYIADEDERKLRIVPLPIGSAPAREVALPGRPAQLVVLSDRLLVTIREPGLLLSLTTAAEGPEIRQRIVVPADAWGLAVTPDERTAVVASAWTRKVSAVDLAAGEVRWSQSVAREPRGVVVMTDGERAYVTHLVGSDITRIDGLTEDPQSRSVELPAGRFSQPLPGTFGEEDTALHATLAYAPALSPDGQRLFVPRHAVGGVGWAPWFGRAVVDVMLTADDSALAPQREHRGHTAKTHFDDQFMVADLGETVALPQQWIVQPRASAYRRSTDSLLVVSEGDGRVTELDARALDPSLHPRARYELIHDGKDSDRCGAPSGIALSRDEQVAFVWCRTTRELARIDLKPESYTAGPDGKPNVPTFFALAERADDEPIALGKRLFFDARSDAPHNKGVSGGLACAGCHPDGRDDGHVWFEGDRPGALRAAPLPNRFDMHSRDTPPWLNKPIVGKPRQTPMLAGRVEPEGPYGWKADAETLDERIMMGFGIHRWAGHPTTSVKGFAQLHGKRAAALAAYLREGLVPPPQEHRVLTARELRGKALFELPTTGCSTCHSSANDYSDRALYTLALSQSAVGAPEAPRFRVPSLLYAGGSAPYLHDGSQPTLGALVDAIGRDMGSTKELSGDDREALAAYLATIGMVSGEPAALRSAEAMAWPFPVVRGGAVVKPEPAPHQLVGGQPWPATTSPEPTRAEWAAAAEIAVRHQADGCRVWRVREWVLIQCIPGLKTTLAPGTLNERGPEFEPVQRVALIAGDERDVTLRRGNITGRDGEGVVIFPLRRGTRRFIEIDRRVITKHCWRWSEWFMAATFTIAASWVGDKPELVITRYGRHPLTGKRLVRQC